MESPQSAGAAAATSAMHAVVADNTTQEHHVGNDQEDPVDHRPGDRHRCKAEVGHGEHRPGIDDEVGNTVS